MRHGDLFRSFPQRYPPPVEGGSGFWPGPGQAMIGDVVYDTVADAAAAYLVGDLIMLGLGNHTCDGVTFSNGVKIHGPGSEFCALVTTTASFVLDLDDSSELKGFGMVNTTTSGDAFALLAGSVGVAAAVFLMDDVYAHATGIGTGDRYGASIINCEVLANRVNLTASGGANGYGLACAHTSSNKGIWRATDGKISGSTTDVQLNTSGGEAYFDGTELVNATFGNPGGGVLKGVYRNGDNLISLNRITSAELAGSVGTAINEFSTDGTLAGNSDLAVPTEKVLRTKLYNVPQAFVYLNTTDLWPNNSSISDIPFNVELYDTDNMWGPFMGGDIRKMVAKTAGVYQVTCGWGWAANTSGIRVLRILHNGATRYYAQTINPGASALQMTVGGPIRMAVNDYVQVEVYQNSGGDLSAYRPVTLSLYLSATLISYL